MEDFHDAAARHFEDAKLLHNQVPPRLANASHLYGFSAECALKAMMLGAKKRGTVPHKHLPEIMTEFEHHTAVTGNPKLIRRVKECCIGLTGWRVEERYYNHITFNPGRVQSEAESAKRLLGLLSLWKREAI